MKKETLCTLNYETDFDEILLQAIDDVLLTLGEGSRAAFYGSLEKSYSLKRRDIPRRINDFSDALDKIFGLAARNLEIIFMKQLHRKIESLDIGTVVEPVPTELTFQRYVCTLRQSFDEIMKNKRKPSLEFFINGGERKEQHQ